jgi:hypothetical protein
MFDRIKRWWRDRKLSKIDRWLMEHRERLVGVVSEHDDEGWPGTMGGLGKRSDRRERP